MDSGHFDLLTRILSQSGARRRLLQGLAAFPIMGGLAWLSGDEGSDAAKGRKQKRRKKRRRRKERRNRKRVCYPGKSCTPGVGDNHARCDFSESVAFFERDVQGANFHQANFSGAQLARADLRGADLGDACLVGANLLDAIIDDTTTMEGAVFCHTLMPDGSINDDGCTQATRCCPTRCKGETCPTTCEEKRGDLCSVIGFPTPVCCEPFVCTPGIASPLLTSCQVPCTTTEACQSVLPGTVCRPHIVHCPYIGKCCAFEG